jgi:hypothetical protein
MAWVKIDVASRKKDVSRLLSLVKLPLLTPSVRSCLRHICSVDYLLRVKVKAKVISYACHEGLWGSDIIGPFILNIAHNRVE